MTYKNSMGKEIKDVLLFVEDRDDVAKMFRSLAAKKKLPYRLLIARNFTDAYRLTMEFVPNVIVTDYDLEEDFTGADLLKEMRERFGRDIEKTIIITGEPPSRQEHLYSFVDKIFVKGATTEIIDYLREIYEEKYSKEPPPVVVNESEYQDE